MPVIESKLIMRLQDEMSGNAAKVTTALDKVKGAEHALGIQSDKLNSATKKLRDFGKLDLQLNETSAALEKNREKLKQLGGAILATEGPTKGLEKQYRAAQKTVDMLSGKFDAQKKALGEVGAAFEKLAGAPIHSVSSAEQRLRVDIDNTTDAIKRQMAASTEVRRVEERNAQRRQALADLKTNVGMLAGPAVLHATEEGVRSGATVQHERVRLRQLGKSITDEQIAEIERNSLEIASKFKTVTQADMMHMQRNAVTILGDVEEAMKIAEPMAKLRVIADAQHPGQSSDEDFDQLIKGLEIGGATKDPKKFESYMDGIARGLNAFGDTVKPSQYYEMFKYGRGATPMLSQDFMLSIAPSLGGELGGSSFGKAVSGFEQTIVSGRMKKQAGQQFAHLGLVRPQDLQEGAGGEVSVKKGASIKGWQLAQADPFEWVRTVLLPAIEKKGIKDPQQQAKIVGQLFGDSTVQQLVSIMLMQKDRILKDQRIVKGAKGSESYKDYLSDDAFPALAGLGTALKTFTGALTAPGIERAAHVMDGISTGLGHLSEAYGAFAAEHPHMAEAIGDLTAAVAAYKGLKLSYQLGAGLLKTLTGAGGAAALAGSATALDGSALALDKSALSIEAAAGRLGVTGATTAVEGAAPGAAAAAGITAGGLAASVAAVAAPIALAIVAGKYEKDREAETAKTWNTPQAQALPDLGKQSWADFLWGKVPGHADGGIVHGPGGSREDRVLRRLSPGEYVVNAAATARHRAVLDAMNGGNIVIPGLADGGPVGTSSGGLMRIALASDSTSAAMLHAAMASAVYEALRRIKGEGGLYGDGGSSGTGATGDGDGGGTPNMRYGRGSSGRYRGTPGTGQDYETGPHVALGKMGAKFAEKAPTIMDGLMKKYGLTREQAAGVVGNLGHESAGFTAYHEGGQASSKGGVGWAQWTGPRRRAFEAWTAAHGLNPTSDEASWRYLTEGDPETAKAIAAVKGTNNRRDAVRAWHDAFERSADIRNGQIVKPRSWNSRLSYADQAFAGTPRGATVTADAPGSTPTPPPDGVGGRAVALAGRLDGASAAQAAQALGHAMHAGQWCADFANGLYAKVGIKGTGSAMASSFRNWGSHVAFGDVKPGDAIVEDHGRGRGHVGVATGAVQRDRAGNVVALGMTSGNHGNRVHRDYWEKVDEITDLRRSNEALAAEADARQRAIQLRPAAAVPAGPVGAGPQHHAMTGSVDFDHSGLDAAIAKVDHLHNRLKALKATASVDMNIHHHNHEASADAGSPKFRPFRSHAGAPAGRILV